MCRRFQSRAAGNKFAAFEYHVYDCPQAIADLAAGNGEKPHPEIQEAEKPQQIPASGFSVSGNSGTHTKY